MLRRRSHVETALSGGTLPLPLIRALGAIPTEYLLLLLQPDAGSRPPAARGRDPGGRVAYAQPPGARGTRESYRRGRCGRKRSARIGATSIGEKPATCGWRARDSRHSMARIPMGSVSGRHRISSDRGRCNHAPYRAHRRFAGPQCPEPWSNRGITRRRHRRSVLSGGPRRTPSARDGNSARQHARSAASVKQYERLAIEAAVRRRWDLAAFALTINPIVGSWDAARTFLKHLESMRPGLFRRFPEWRYPVFSDRLDRVRFSSPP